MNLWKLIKVIIKFFFLKRLAATIIFFVAVMNIVTCFFGEIAYINFNYDQNSNATMKVVTAVSFLLVALGRYVSRKKALYVILLSGVLIQLWQLLGMRFGLYENKSSIVTIALFLLTYSETFSQKILANKKIAICLNTIIYLITLFAIYYFVINPKFLASIPGFESVSWNTVILFYIYVLSALQSIFQKTINQVFSLQKENNYNLNPFKYFPFFFGVPIAVVILTSFLIHFRVVDNYFGMFIILFVLNMAIIASAAIFTYKFIKLFRIIADSQRKVTYQNTKLIEKNRHMEDFASITSHNLKEPIIAINNILEFRKNEQLKGSISEEDLDHMLTTNIKNLSQSIESVNRFLQAIRKGEHGNFEYITLQESLETQQKQLSDFNSKLKANFQIDIKDQPTFPKVYMDSILYNLLSNSYKYNDPQRTLEISIKACFINDDYVIKFSDNGLGIDLNRHGAHIFKPNKRFHKTNVSSSGFGLYFTKMHVEKLDGTIQLESEVNKGSTFTLTFKNKKYESSNNR